jgi:hypothetical protein
LESTNPTQSDVFNKTFDHFWMLETLEGNKPTTKMSTSSLDSVKTHNEERLKKNWFFRKFLNKRIKMLNSINANETLKSTLLEKYVDKLNL